MNNNFLNIYRTVYENAILANKMLRVATVDCSVYLSTHQYRHEFATIKINLGRRTGKTRFINSRNNYDYVNYENRYGKDYVIVPSRLYNKVDYYHCVNVIKLNDGFNLNTLRGRVLASDSIIWVDDYSYFDNKSLKILDEILFLLYTNTNQTVIMLG